MLANKDAWIAFNITSAQVTDAAKVAVKAGVKRVVLAVNLTIDESTSENLVFQEAQDIFKAAEIQFTIVKYSQTRQMAEAKYPYRVTRDVLPLPSETPLSDGDLMRVSIITTVL